MPTALWSHPNAGNNQLQTDYAELVSEMRRARDEQAVQETVTERLMYPDGRLN
jgi:hypothetical protein